MVVNLNIRNACFCCRLFSWLKENIFPTFFTPIQCLWSSQPSHVYIYLRWNHIEDNAPEAQRLKENKDPLRESGDAQRWGTKRKKDNKEAPKKQFSWIFPLWICLSEPTGENSKLVCPTPRSQVNTSSNGLPFFTFMIIKGREMSNWEEWKN